MGKLRGLGSNSLKQVVDEAVHDAHSLRGYTSVRVDLLKHLDQISSACILAIGMKDLVDVDCVGLLPLSLALLLVTLGNSLGGLARLGGSFTRGFGRHFESNFESAKGNLQKMHLCAEAQSKMA